MKIKRIWGRLGIHNWYDRVDGEKECKWCGKVKSS